MLRLYRDAANACTLAALVFGGAALAALAAGEPWAALSAMLAAVVCDMLDGPLARATPGRSAELGAFGGMLDSLADQVHSVLAPAAFIATVVGGPQGLAVAGVLVIAGTTRLAYFSSFGLLPGGAFLGLPVFYTPMILATVAIATTPLGSGNAAVALGGTGVAIALAQVSRLRIPRFADWRLWGLVLLTLFLAATCLARALGAA